MKLLLRERKWPGLLLSLWNQDVYSQLQLHHGEKFSTLLPEHHLLPAMDSLGTSHASIETPELISVNPDKVTMDQESNHSSDCLLLSTKKGLRSQNYHEDNLTYLPMEEFSDLSTFLPTASKEMTWDPTYSTDKLNTLEIYDETLNNQQYTSGSNNKICDHHNIGHITEVANKHKDTIPSSLLNDINNLTSKTFPGPNCKKVIQKTPIFESEKYYLEQEETGVNELNIESQNMLSDYKFFIVKDKNNQSSYNNGLNPDTSFQKRSLLQDKYNKKLKLNVNLDPEHNIFENFVLSTPDVIESVVSLEECNLLQLLDDKAIPVSPIVSQEALRDPNDEGEFLSNSSTVSYVDTINKFEIDSEEVNFKKHYGDYQPSDKRTRKRKQKFNFDDESDESTTSLNKKQKSNSCTSSVTISSKYRELRDKNNEASKKSRAKRKLKEQLLEEEAEKLQNKNIKLKARVAELEKTVTNFRKGLFKSIIKT